MKIKLNRFFILLIGTLLFSGSVYAQRGGETQYANPLLPSKKATPIYFGPAGGVNIMGHSMDKPTIEQCNVFQSAAGLGIYAGLTLERLFGDVATSSSSVIFRVLFNMYPGTNTIDDIPYNAYDPINDRPVSTTVQDGLDISYNAVTFEVMYKINPIPAMGLGIVVGPAIDYILTKNVKQKYSILTPTNAQFPLDLLDKYPGAIFEDEYRRIAIIYDGEIEEASSIRFGIKAGVQYEILLGSKLYIAPALAYNFGITNVTTTKHSWRVSPIQIGMDLRFAF